MCNSHGALVFMTPAASRAVGSDWMLLPSRGRDFRSVQHQRCAHGSDTKYKENGVLSL